MKIGEFTFVPEEKDRPLKVVYEDDAKLIKIDDCAFKFATSLTPMESKKFFENAFGTTDIGVLDCGDISDEEFERIVDKFNSIPEGYPIFAEELKKILGEQDNAMEET